VGLREAKRERVKCVALPPLTRGNKERRERLKKSKKGRERGGCSGERCLKPRAGGLGSQLLKSLTRRFQGSADQVPGPEGKEKKGLRGGVQNFLEKGAGGEGSSLLG